MRRTLLLAALLVLAAVAPAPAAVGHGAPGAGVSAFLKKVSGPAAPHATVGAAAISGTAAEATTWGGGILALEGFRRLAAPVTAAMAKLLGGFLPSSAAGKLAGVATEFLSGAAFKAGMDVGESFAKTGQLKAPDWLEVAGAAAGMVAGGLLLRPLGPFGDAIGSWIGWSLGENLARQFRAGKQLSLVDAFREIDVPRLAIQAVTTEGIGILAPKLASSLFGGLTGPAGTIAGLGLQIGLTVVAQWAANGVADRILGPAKDADPDSTDVASLDRQARDAYQKFVSAARRSSLTSPEARKALGDYRALKAKLDAARLADR